MAHPALSGREAERRAGEAHARPRAGETRPEQRLDALSLVRRDLRLDELRVGVGLGGIVSAAHVHLDVAKAVLREVLLQQLERTERRHVGYEAHVDLRDGAMR